jgi:hypothetical protein
MAAFCFSQEGFEVHYWLHTTAYNRVVPQFPFPTAQNKW